MARPGEPKCKYCRRAGEKLFLKGERCYTPKCAVVRKPYRPGQHGKSRRRLSDYGKQLLEKQKIRWIYGLSERQFRRYFKQAEQAQGVLGEEFIQRLERRLDNTVFRLGLAPSRDAARQMVAHRHITVNGRITNIPSFEVSPGDGIAVREESQGSGLFDTIQGRLKNYTPPPWLALDKAVLRGSVEGLPAMDDTSLPADVQMVIEYYSR